MQERKYDITISKTKNNVVFVLGSVVEIGGNDFAGLLIPLDPNMNAICVAKLDKTGKQEFFITAQGAYVGGTDNWGLYILRN